MTTQAEKGRLFRARHAKPGILILPNPWDAGTAKLLQSLGFEALATTSLGMSNALGRADGEGAVSRAELIENCRIIAEATDLPVNADLENGYADDPKQAATILRDACAVGIVGGSIEDWSGERIYDFNHAVERVVAGVEMARSLPVPFTFVARAENLSRGRNDLDDRCARSRDHEARRLIGDQADQRGDERRRSRPHGAPDGGGRRQAPQRRRRAVTARAGGLHERGARDEGQRRLHLDERHHAEQGPQGGVQVNF